MSRTGRRPTGPDVPVAPIARGHRSLAHTADVMLEAWGPDLASSCEEAVGALVETYVGGSHGRHLGEHRFCVAPGAPEEMLLCVLDEVIFALDTAPGVPIGATISPSDDGGLVVTLALADARHLEPTGAVPKAVSRSELLLEVVPGRVGCRFLVDL